VRSDSFEAEIMYRPILLMSIAGTAVAPGTMLTTDTNTARPQANFFMLSLTGTTAQRPLPADPNVVMSAGMQYYDTTLSESIWYDGASWRTAAGEAV
jgi:hypothetical protein